MVYFLNHRGGIFLKKAKLSIFLISLIFILTGCNSNKFTIQQNWNLELPKDSNEVYHKDTGTSFHGDGTSYTVYQTDDAASVKSMADWTTNSSSTVFTDNFPAFATYCLDKLDVPSEERIDFEHCQYYYRIEEDSSELLLVYNSELKLLYIIENRL